ncbi:MAG: haloacid dehalogenase type II [Pseudomonadota bacterium]
MAGRPLGGQVDACVFDAYGTLFDVHSAVAREGRDLGERSESVSALWRQKQLEYTWLRSLMGQHRDFLQITADALDFALEHHRVDDPDVRQRLLDAYSTLDVYPEVPATLQALRAAGLRTAILSNGSPTMLEAAVRHGRLSAGLDAVLSVEAVGIFKPAPEVYRLATDLLEVPAASVCFCSANGWDVHGAASFGFRVVWVDRLGQVDERLPGCPEAVVPGLDGLLPVLGLG